MHLCQLSTRVPCRIHCGLFMKPMRTAMNLFSEAIGSVNVVIRLSVLVVL